MKTKSLCGMSLKCPSSPVYFVNVFIKCCARNLEDLAYKSELGGLSLIRRRNIYTSLVNNALNIKTLQTFIVLHKIHRVMRRQAINMSEHTVQCNYCQHTVIKMQHDAKIVQSIFHDYNWFYGQYLDSLNVVLLLCSAHCKDLIATRLWLCHIKPKVQNPWHQSTQLDATSSVAFTFSWTTNFNIITALVLSTPL
jgi:hypothetical protein